MPATKRVSAKSGKATSAGHANNPGDEALFEAWLSDFDARHADVAARLDALLHSLGVEPGTFERQPA